MVSLLVNGANRREKDALRMMYKLCSIKQNKERVVTTGTVKMFTVGGGAGIGDSREGNGGVD